MLDNISVIIWVVCLKCSIVCLFVFFYFFLSLPFVFDPKLLQFISVFHFIVNLFMSICFKLKEKGWSCHQLCRYKKWSCDFSITRIQETILFSFYNKCCAKPVAKCSSTVILCQNRIFVFLPHLAIGHVSFCHG